MLEFVRSQFCAHGKLDEEERGTTENPDKYLEYWGAEHQEIYLGVKQVFLDYATRLQAVFDQVIDGMLKKGSDGASRKGEDEAKESIDIMERGREERERLVRTSLWVMNHNEKRWFAQEVEQISGEPDVLQKLRTLLFEMKKEGYGSVKEIMARLHIKFIEEMLFQAKNNKMLVV